MTSRVAVMHLEPTTGEKEKENKCWLFGFTPRWAQQLAVFPVFMFFLCMNAILQGMMVNGFISTSISSIEKRFALTSTRSGMFSGTYDVAVAFMLLPLSIMAHKVNKVRTIGYGMIFVGIGALLLCVPQFLDGNYTVGELKLDHCDPDRQDSCDDQQQISSWSFPILLLSQTLIGVGAAPLFTYGYSTIDEFDAHKRTGTNMAIFMGVSTVGPAFAFIGGGQLLKIWGDIGKTEPASLGISGPEDPRWYGAWWIGFAAAGALSFLTAIPLLMFPKKLNDTDKRKENDTIQTHADLDVNFDGKKWPLLRTFWLFTTNRTCMCLIAMQTFESSIMNGYITFIPKILENFFGYSSSWASTVTGLVVVPMGLLGSFIGGKAGEHVGNKVPQLMKMCMICCVVTALASSALLLQCPSSEIAGINVPYDSQGNINVTHTCNADCHCDNLFNPVCNHKTNVSYLSPCHAGCQSGTSLVSSESWHTCSCASLQPIAGGAVSKGWCPIDCGYIQHAFFALFSIMACFIFASAPLVQSAALRVVSFKHRDEFICYGWMWMRIFGSIPGAVLFGYIIDLSCMQWISGCDGGKKCVTYNATELSHSIFYMTMITKSLCFFCLVAADYSYIPVPDCEDPTLKKPIKETEAITHLSTKVTKESEI